MEFSFSITIDDDSTNADFCDNFAYAFKRAMEQLPFRPMLALDESFTVVSGAGGLQDATITRLA